MFQAEVDKHGVGNKALEGVGQAEINAGEKLAHNLVILSSGFHHGGGLTMHGLGEHFLQLREVLFES